MIKQDFDLISPSSLHKLVKRMAGGYKGSPKLTGFAAIQPKKAVKSAQKIKKLWGMEKNSNYQIHSFPWPFPLIIKVIKSSNSQNEEKLFHFTSKIKIASHPFLIKRILWKYCSSCKVLMYLFYIHWMKFKMCSYIANKWYYNTYHYTYLNTLFSKLNSYYIFN